MSIDNTATVRLAKLNRPQMRENVRLDKCRLPVSPGFNIALQRDLDPSVGMADLYPQEITRVLLNIIANGFYAATKRKAEAGEGFEPTLAAVTKNQIDRSGYLGLEEFVRDQLLSEGLSANLTQRSGDGGADIVVRDELGKIVYLIQCKHTSNIESPIDGGLLQDAQRVRENWQARDAIVFGVSNAKRFAPRVVEGFKNINGRLIARDQLARVRFR
jgi:hypothetical protein